MIERRKFLQIGAWGLGLLALGSLNLSCKSKSNKTGNRPIPIYLTSSHDWFHAAVWHAIANNYLRIKDFENMQLDQYDSHNDFAEVILNENNPVPFIEDSKNFSSEQLKETFDREMARTIESLFINNFNTLGAYEGIFSEFNWYFNTWSSNETRLRHKEWVSRKGKLLYIKNKTNSGEAGVNSTKFYYTQEPIKNQQTKNENYMVTIDLDFFSLCHPDIPPEEVDFNDLELMTKKLTLILNNNCNEKSHVMSDREFAERDEIMKEFVNNNFRKDIPPKLIHICESPMYCPRTHAPFLLDSLLNAIKNFYPLIYKDTLDFRDFELKNDPNSKMVYEAVK